MHVNTWTGVEVLALREALRLSQPKFAELLHYSDQSVSKWERAGADREIKGTAARALDAALAELDEKSPQLARFRTAMLRTGAPMIGGAEVRDSSTIENDVVERRQFGAVVGVAALATLPTGLACRVGVGDATRVNHVVDEFVARDQKEGGTAVLADAVDALEHVNTLLETCVFESSAAEDAFTGAVGKLAMRVGWLAYDADRPQLARRSYAEALALANIAGDDGLTIHGCINSAMLAISTGSPRRARRLTARAGDFTHRLPPGRIHALLAVREATAHAALNDGSGFARSISSAWREMDRAAEHEPLDDCPAWLRFMSHNEVQFHEAKGLAFLGHHPEAVDLYSQVAQQQDTPRNVVCGRAQLAAALAAVGDYAEAETEATAVLEQLAEGVASTRALRLLEPLRDSLAQRSGDDAFTDHFDGVARHFEAIGA